MASRKEPVEGDREALQEVFDTAVGLEWRNVPRWHGVTLNEQGRVETLNLAKKKLRGMMNRPSSRELSASLLRETNLATCCALCCFAASFLIVAVKSPTRPKVPIFLSTLLSSHRV